MVKRLGIFTAGGLARAVASHFSYEYLTECFVDKTKVSGEHVHNIPVVLFPPPIPKDQIKYVIACGDTKRKRVLAESDVAWETLVHRSATVSPRTEVGEGSVICPGVVIDPDVRIGRHVYVDHNAVIGHGADVEDYVVIGPVTLIAGYCKIGAGAYVGAGVSVVREANIGEDSTIGAGAVVLGDVPPNEVWAGVPAKKIGEVTE